MGDVFWPLGEGLLTEKARSEYQGGRISTGLSTTQGLAETTPGTWRQRDSS